MTIQYNFQNFCLCGKAKMRTKIKFAFSYIYLATQMQHWEINAELRWLCMLDDDKDWGEEMNWYVGIQKEDCCSSRNTKDQVIKEKNSPKLKPAWTDKLVIRSPLLWNVLQSTPLKTRTASVTNYSEISTINICSM